MVGSVVQAPAPTTPLAAAPAPTPPLAAAQAPADDIAERVRIQNETVESLQNQLEKKARIDIDQKVFKEISRQLL